MWYIGGFVVRGERWGVWRGFFSSQLGCIFAVCGGRGSYSVGEKARLCVASYTEVEENSSGLWGSLFIVWENTRVYLLLL